jgi:hypothetical protein
MNNNLVTPNLTAAYTAAQVSALQVCPKLGSEYQDPVTGKKYKFLKNAGATTITAQMAAVISDASAFTVAVNNTLNAPDFAGARVTGATDLAQNESGWFQISGNATLILGASANALTANQEGIVIDDDADCGKVGKAVITTGATVNQTTTEAALAGVNGVFALNQGGALSATDADVECQLIRNCWGS